VHQPSRREAAGLTDLVEFAVMRMDGTSAVVSGGASGLGEGTVRRLTAAGARCTILDRNAEAGEALARQVDGAFIEVDVSDSAQVGEAFSKTSSSPLRICVNCAGIGAANRVLNRDGTPHDPRVFDRVVRVNLMGTFNVLCHAAALMAANEPGEDGERGVIINTSSIAAFDGQIGQLAYSASKGAVVGMTLPAARDLASFGIRVLTIAPGIMDTPLLGQLPEEAKAVLGAGVPFPKRMGTPDDFGRLAVHMVENRYLNGEVVRLDAGLRMQPR
jgi:NAD(P)-dependent dehydrogenase (short-subunit alcohol dehydrogenase family)